MYDYKADGPALTVRRIKGILKGIGIQTQVEHRNYAKGIYSCRVTISNPVVSRCNIGCNGKGTTPEYAEASGYAELMERIQNRILGFEAQKYAASYFRKQQLFPALPFQQSLSHELPFIWFPDESVEDVDFLEIQEWIKKVHPAYTSPASITEELETSRYSVFVTDFYDLSAGCVRKGPIELMRYLSDTTGMCAGNNAAEAILQGINEICERFILQAVYLKSHRFPRYDESLLSETTRRLIASLCADKYTCCVINCSLNGLLPVMGVLVQENREDGSYFSFRLGADLNPDVAVSRCVTEICQGLDSTDKLPLWKDSGTLSMTYEYHRSLVNGSGRIPLEILDLKSFSGNYPDDLRKPTRRETLMSLIQHLKNQGISVWVRDNSFLSFPSYYVYSPELSPVSDSLRNNFPFVFYQVSKAGFFGLNPKYHLGTLRSSFDLNWMHSFLSANIGKTLTFFPYSLSSEGNSFEVLVLLLEFQLFLGKYPEALDTLHQIQDAIYIESEYAAALETAILLRIRGESTNVIRMCLEQLAIDPELVEDIVQDMMDHNPRAFSSYKKVRNENLFIKDSAYGDWIEIQYAMLHSFDTHLSQRNVAKQILASD